MASIPSIGGESSIDSLLHFVQLVTDLNDLSFIKSQLHLHVSIFDCNCLYGHGMWMHFWTVLWWLIWRKLKNLAVHSCWTWYTAHVCDTLNSVLWMLMLSSHQVPQWCVEIMHMRNCKTKYNPLQRTFHTTCSIQEQENEFHLKEVNSGTKRFVSQKRKWNWKSASNSLTYSHSSSTSIPNTCWYQDISSALNQWPPSSQTSALPALQAHLSIMTDINMLCLEFPAFKSRRLTNLHQQTSRWYVLNKCITACYDRDHSL